MFFGTPPPPPEFPHSLDDMELTSEDIVFFNDNGDINDHINIYDSNRSCTSHTCGTATCKTHVCVGHNCEDFSCETYDDNTEHPDPGECPSNE